MENATKALLIAAGVLFAVIIISIAVVVYNNISDFYQTKQSNISEEQLAAFNIEYTAYERDLTGIELVGLINKIMDFNSRNPEEEGYKPMEIEVTIDGSKYSGALFTSKTYTGKNNNKGLLMEIITKMRNLEKKYSASVLSKLVENSIYNEIKEYFDTGDKNIEDVVGKKLKQIPDIDDLKEYEDYINFKRAKFSFVSDAYTQNGQIYQLKYKSK